MKKIETIDAYIKTFPKDVRAVLQRIRRIIKKLMPKAQELISYQIPAFKLNGKYVVYFAGWKKHVSLYPIPKGTKAFQKEIVQYKGGKGTIQFPLNKPMPYSLIKKIAIFHIKERF